MSEYREGVRGSLLKIVLLLIFSMYTCSITFFTHSHIIGGVTIVHSHFYGTDENGKPTHEHTGAEIQLIQHLSTYFSLAAAIVAVLIGFIPLRKTALFVSEHHFFKQAAHYNQFRLRAPPVL